ncbi:MAG: hypothetical protein A2015_13130 [Spirochaetes bacterium GWF1_31_7]|nr:MAG: hypothetical protein A2Y30_00535 [Spirochaetes bacterium GWE1_32_154]OHD51328.1 MAG: hypothetical protein A2Y29_00980 [Spirochaetes bacterium GWE2_31_10]OHD51525.1 MAG: hypothetical protein A2015_13130 [Spirochaetes bacterium GWF1_31_7]HBD95874.1 hypothetical protein [Spirochaetia bacterium]HBI38150.1 hypothetical protein [Spirochaetia bacterium]
MKKNIYIVTILIFILSCTNTSNLFVGAGKAPDINKPSIEIIEPSGNKAVKGLVTITGKAIDDLGADSVEFYHVQSEASGTVDVLIGTVKVKNEQFSYTLDTTVFEDGANLFKAKVIEIDKAGKFAFTNITLILDNYGPFVIINQPEENKASSPIYSIFTASILPVDYEENSITGIDWKIASDANPEHEISGSVDYSITPLTTNESLSFQIDPFGLLKIADFEPGFCTLSIRCKNQNDAYSREYAVKKIYIDFGDSIPRIFITTPTSKDENVPTNTGSSIIITGLAKDDSSVELVEFEWGAINGNMSVIILPVSESGVVTSYSISQQITDLENGDYKIRARITDDLQNISDWTDFYYFRADSNYPSIKITSPAQGSWVNGDVDVTGTVGIGLGSIISEISYKIEGETVWTTLSKPNSSSASFTLPVKAETYPLGGEIKVYLRGYKDADNFTEGSVLFNMDNRIPDLIMNSPVEGALQLNQKILIQGTASDLVGDGVDPGIIKDIRISISGTSIEDELVNGISSFQYEFDSFANNIGLTGNQDVSVTLKAEDQAGNSSIVLRNLTINQLTDIPVVTVDNLSAGDKKYGIFTVLGTATDDDAIKDVEVQIDDTGWQKASGSTNWSFKIDGSQLSIGDHTLYYRTRDIYNINSEYDPGSVVGYPRIKSVLFEIDPDVPVIEFNSLYNAAFNNDAVFSGTISKSSGGFIKSAEIKIAGTLATKNWTALSGSEVTDLNTNNATFAYPISVDEFGDGQIRVYMRAMDDMDKITEQETIIFMDSKSLTGSLSAPASNYEVTGNNLTITGSILDDEPSSGVIASNVKIYAINTTDSNTRTDIVDGTAVKITTALSNFSFVWNIPASQKDGVYDIYLDATDRAGNGFSVGVKKVTGIRLARYKSEIIDVFVNRTALTNNTYIRQTCEFKGTLRDENPNDKVSGVKSIYIYQSADAVYNSGDTLLGFLVFSGTETMESFVINASITSTSSYIILRASDIIGGVTETVYQVIVDYTPPTPDFTYSSVGHDGVDVTIATATGYSDSFWIKLGATDTIDGTASGNMDGSTIQAGLGTTSGDTSIIGNKIYTVNSYLKADLKGKTGIIYLNYSLYDKAGNVTNDSLPINAATGKPTLAVPGLSGSWINSITIPTTGSTGTVKYSAVDFDGEINELSGSLTSVAGGNINIGGTSNGDHTITVISTDAQSRNIYEKYSFTLDTVSPVISSFTVTEDDGAVNGRVDGANLSGRITFSAVVSDNEMARLNTTDLLFKVKIGAGAVTDITALSTVVKNSDNSFSWSWEYDTQTYVDKVGSGIDFVFTVTDKAGNQSLDNNHTYNIVPYIRSITEVTGKIVAVKRWDSTTSTWRNTLYDEMYSYRINGTNSITLNGFNLNAAGNETVSFSGGAKSWTVAGISDNTLSFDLTGQGSDITYGNLTVATGGITSNAKKIYVFNNYAAPADFSNIAEADMVVKDDDNALVVYQKHFSEGSGAYRLWETNENTFLPNTTIDNAFYIGNYIAKAYNRMWFVHLAKDRGATFDATDGKYYLFNDDSEMNANTKGLQLTGNFGGWETLPNRTGSGYIYQPTNDWNFNQTGSVVGNNTDERRYGNRWRMSMPNDDNRDGIGDGGALEDYSVSWADMYAYNNNVHVVWYSELDKKTYYRMIVNAVNNSLKYPTTGAVDLGLSGKSYPAITITSGGFPVITAYDETAGALKVFTGNAVQASSFANVTVESGTFAYPKISCIESGGNYHLFYQDTNNGQLKYAYAVTVAGLNTATKVVLDSEGVPGNYNDIRVVDNKPAVTYIARGYLNTGNAVRVTRYTGSGTTATDYNTKANWEIVTLPCERNITENKVRGYVVGTGATAWYYGFAKSDRPEFFREKK